MERAHGLSISSASNLVIYGEKWQAARRGGAYLQAQCCCHGGMLLYPAEKINLL